MAFTYSPGTSRGRVRLLISDTDTADATKQIFTDAEIDAFLSLGSNEVFKAASFACRSIAADKSKSAIAWRVFESQFNRQQIPRYFLDLADKYQAEAESGAPGENFDYADYAIDGFGIDQSEYTGDVFS